MLRLNSFEIKSVFGGSDCTDFLVECSKITAAASLASIVLGFIFFISAAPLTRRCNDYECSCLSNNNSSFCDFDSIKQQCGCSFSAKQ